MWHNLLPDSLNQSASSSIMCKVSLWYNWTQWSIQVGRVYTSHFGGSVFGSRPGREPRLLSVLVSVPDQHIYVNYNYKLTASCYIFCYSQVLPFSCVKYELRTTPLNKTQINKQNEETYLTFTDRPHCNSTYTNRYGTWWMYFVKRLYSSNVYSKKTALIYFLRVDNIFMDSSH